NQSGERGEEGDLAIVRHGRSPLNSGRDLASSPWASIWVRGRGGFRLDRWRVHSATFDCLQLNCACVIVQLDMHNCIAHYLFVSKSISHMVVQEETRTKVRP